MVNKNIIVTLLVAAAAPVTGAAQKAAYNTPGAGNPILPGYFADPTVKKFGDTYYIYATTDGSGAGFGPAQLWCSKDFKNWTLMPMNWPDSHWIWAPDVMYNDKDNKYYYLYCQPCRLFLGEGLTPRGPWKNVLGESEAVLVEDRFVKNAITLDGQTFIDDDGSVYMYWGTWGIYPGFGCGAGKLNPDMKSFSETKLIENTEVKHFFEAPFVFKRNGIYYFLYSCEHCEDASYRVDYATAEHPMGPYTYHGTILKTNEDGTVHGPGHNSVLKEGDNYYIVYHRHDNPHSNRGFHRQVAMDKLEFNADGTIKPVVPTHDGIDLHPEMTVAKNLAYQAKVTASSYYDENFRPEYAVDDNNGTLWRPQNTGPAWIQIDLGKKEKIKTIWTQFEYGTQFYQYLIETSEDGKLWKTFSDKRGNRLAGSPMVDFGDTKARYVRLTYTGGQKNGFGGAIWNIKVYGDVQDSAPQQWLGLSGADFDGVAWQNQEGMLGGKFDVIQGTAKMERVGGDASQIKDNGEAFHGRKDALVLQPGTVLRMNQAQIGKTREHTLSALTYQNGAWKQIDENDSHISLTDGKLEISAGDTQFIITNLRYYNWKQTAAEKQFDAQSDILRNDPADTHTQGLVVDINADYYEVNDTVPFIKNGSPLDVHLKGEFEVQSEPAAVREIAGKKAFCFTGKEMYRSNFMLPATIRDNAPYTIDAWILNPEMEENECVADFTSTHNELEKIMVVNGTEPRCGVLNHYGFYEDVGYKDIKKLEGKWQHLYVCFDGRMQRVYINDQLISEKDVQLLFKPSQFILLGRNAEGAWPFSGYLHSLKLWDEFIPKK